MAQAALMGPPLSPREIRRSGRRSAPSASTSTSKSPDSPTSESASRSKENSNRTPMSAPTNNARNRKMKLEEIERSIDDLPNTVQTNGSVATHGNANGSRSKRKAKDREKKENSPEPQDSDSITRCICGKSAEEAEDHPDLGEFMVQCETCKVWQHGFCMGYEVEEQLDDSYWCEQCRPELHQDLINRRKQRRKVRQSSANSHNTSAAAASRLSRSHSPAHSVKPAKRRNTMNSRDAAFDESLKELIEATAAEAAAQDTQVGSGKGQINGHVAPPEEPEGGTNGRKKRKRTDDDLAPKKRTRSASSTSDHTVAPVSAAGDSAVNDIKTPAPPAKTGARTNKRGGRKNAASNPPVETDEAGVPGPSKRQIQGGRTKLAQASKRPPLSHISHVSASHDHSTRRNPSSGSTGQNGPTPAESARAYRHSHAYAVSQQPLFTSWNLPDYLAHLEPMLPTDVPRPIEVRGSGSGTGTGGRESVERTMERGVKVKWPSKRMSVVDMNKRVRALVEWVGREQAGALDRGRRREALEKVMKEVLGMGTGASATHQTAREPKSKPSVEGGDGAAADSDVQMDTGNGVSHTPAEKASSNSDPPTSSMDVDPNGGGIFKQQSSTMKMMEELMEELINFQERFGPGAKSKERERRTAS